jgi:predicted DsbA family dithiol-disulfide isomerase
LNAEEALARLDDQEARDQVQDQEAYWHNAGISSVPKLIINQSSALTGAQPIEV